MGGGDMIREVKMEASKWNTVPYKFEAGTPAIAELIGLGAAVDYLSKVWHGERSRPRQSFGYLCVGPP